MHLSILGPDVLSIHLAPVLDIPSLLALSLTDCYLHAIFSPLRFKSIDLKPRINRGCILDVFRPSTLASITSLNLRSTSAGDHNRICAASGLFTSLRSISICEAPGLFAWLHSAGIPSQRPCLLLGTYFTFFGPQLRQLTIADTLLTPENAAATLTTVSLGTFNSLRSLSLEHAFLPALNQLPTLLGPSSRLTTFTFLPFHWKNPWTIQQSMDPFYIAACHKLLEVLSESVTAPCLRLLELSVPRPSPDDSLRAGLLLAAYTAAYKHRLSGGHGLRLGMRRPHYAKGFNPNFIDPWQCWCLANHDAHRCFFMSAAELGRFRKWSEVMRKVEHKVGATVVHDYIAGSIHVHDLPAGFSQLTANARWGVVMEASSTSVAEDINTYIANGVSCITISLTCFTITNEGKSPPPNIPGSEPNIRGSKPDIYSSKLTSLRITPPYIIPTIPIPEQNLAIRLTAVINPPSHPLQRLSVPAAAFATTPAVCGTGHGSMYGARWLATCGTLRRLMITEWSACPVCFRSCRGLDCEIGRWVPKRVQVSVGGRFDVASECEVSWERVVAAAWKDVGAEIEIYFMPAAER